MDASTGTGSTRPRERRPAPGRKRGRVRSSRAPLLGRGGWDLPLTLPELDPERARQPFSRADVGARVRAPYATHPLYPALLRLGSRVRPVGGLVAISVLGAWLAAVLAALLAETIRPRRGPAALWLVGAMSPLAVDATWVLAHAPAAAAVAAMLLAAERAARLSPLTTPRAMPLMPAPTTTVS